MPRRPREVLISASRIEALRNALGETEQVFGERFGVTGSAVSWWCSGGRTPSKFIQQALVRLEAENAERIQDWRKRVKQEIKQEGSTAH